MRVHTLDSSSGIRPVAALVLYELRLPGVGRGLEWGTDRDRALPPCALPAAPAPRALTHIRLRVSAGRQSDACK